MEGFFDAWWSFDDDGGRHALEVAGPWATYRRRLVAAPAYLAAKWFPKTPEGPQAHACSDTHSFDPQKVRAMALAVMSRPRVRDWNKKKKNKNAENAVARHA